MRLFITALAVFLMATGFAFAADSTLRLAVTTSFENSGLADRLLPEIKADTGLDVQLIVVGTGQALKLGRAGDVDAILVHSRNAEEAFVKEGFATHRREIMYNDFVLVGPSNDPAKISFAASAKEAFSKISDNEALFVSRGDDSGTHKKEVSIWQSAGLESDQLKPNWYRAVGAGMGAALNVASGMNAYCLADRASWLKFANKGSLELLYFGDPALFNQYAFLPVNPVRHPHVKLASAVKLEEWLAGPKAQRLIGSYTLNGQQLFTPNAKAALGGQ